MNYRIFAVIMIFVNLIAITAAYMVNRLAWWHLGNVGAIGLMIHVLWRERKKQ
jgi:hypothetical protein